MVGAMLCAMVKTVVITYIYHFVPNSNEGIVFHLSCHYA